MVAVFVMEYSGLYAHPFNSDRHSRPKKNINNRHNLEHPHPFIPINKPVSEWRIHDIREQIKQLIFGFVSHIVKVKRRYRDRMIEEESECDTNKHIKGGLSRRKSPGKQPNRRSTYDSYPDNEPLIPIKMIVVNDIFHQRIHPSLDAIR